MVIQRQRMVLQYILGDLWNVLGNDVVRKKGTPGVNNEGEGA